MRDAVYDWDVATGAAWWSDAARRLLGCEESAGVACWRQRVHPEDRERAWAGLQSALQSRAEHWTAEFRLLRQGQGIVYARQRGFIQREAEGRARRVAGVIEDLTETRAAEERLNLALWAAEAGTWYTDLKRGVHIRCPGLNRLLGLPPQETNQSNDEFRALVHPDDLPRLEAAIDRAQRQVGAYDVEIRVRRPDGDWRWLRGRGRFIPDEKGEASIVAGAAVDTTDRKRMEEELGAAREQLSSHAAELERAVADRTRQLQAMVAELETFSYTIAHDLRAPLRALEGYTELLRRSLGPELPADRARLLERIAASAKRLDELTRDVLAFSRIGREAAALAPVDLDALIPQLIEQYEAVRAASVSVVAPLGRVVGHEGLLTQAVGNLLVNAVKFVSPGQAPLVRVWTQAASGRVKLFVEDQGIGIELRHQDRIFKPFEKLHSVDLYEGTGIGLAIVRKAAEAMGGSVGVESAPGKGSRFWLDLAQAP